MKNNEDTSHSTDMNTHCLITNSREVHVKIRPAVMAHLVWDACIDTMAFDLPVASD